MGSTVVEWRSAQMQGVRHLASELQPVRDRWRKSLHPQVRKIIGNWRLPLMHVLAMKAGSEDLFFNLDFSCGVRCVGRAAHSFVMPLKVTRPLMTLQELLFQAKTRNRVLLASVRSSGDVELDEASLAKTKQELDAGVMLGSWPADCQTAWLSFHGGFLFGSIMVHKPGANAATSTKCPRAFSTAPSRILKHTRRVESSTSSPWYAFCSIFLVLM